MKKILLIFSLALISQFSFAQQPAPLIWGASPFQDSLWAVDTTAWLPVINVQPVATGSTITGITGLAFDPTTYKSYAILKISPSRFLAEISLQTGSCTIKGDLADRFSSITFDKSGQLYGATGNGATVPEAFFKIDKATASNTLVFSMGNGADGEIICYNRFDDKMYHWSGNGTPVFESWPIASTSYTPANITISGTPGGETFGAICLKANDFIISNISSDFKHTTAAGAYGNSIFTAPDDLRGLVMPPRFAVNTSTLCARNGSLDVYANSLQLYDSVYYYWGDGNVTQLLATSASTAAAAHTYSTAGNYTLTVQLYNGAVAKSTNTTFTVQVSTTPSVSISGSSNLCPGGTVTLTGSGGGSSQWYAAGVAVTGATLNAINITAPGWYNMIKTNLSGCSDSASAGVLVIAVPNPTVTVANATICAGVSTTINPTGAATYTISGGSTVVSPTITTSYSVTGTSTAGCVSANTAVATVSVNPLPTLSLTSSNATICTGESATLAVSGASAYVWNTSATSNTLAITPSLSATYTVTGTSAEGCTNTASISQEVSECTGLMENKLKTESLRVMPNPGAGLFFLEQARVNSNVQVFNTLGQLILKTTVLSDRTSIDLSGYPSGIYVLRVSQNDFLLGQTKLIKE